MFIVPIPDVGPEIIISPVLPCVWIKLFIGALGILMVALYEPFFIDIFSIGVL